MPYQSVFRAGVFEDQTIIVTGGGSGRCTAHELASLGPHVALVGRNPDKIEAVRAEIIKDGGAPNARGTWKLEPSDRSQPFQGFHRAALPELLKRIA